MSINENVALFLDHYLNPQVKTEFAVLIKGPWGAGKTSFVKKYFEQRQKKINSTDPLLPKNYLYASFYGVRSISEISDQFFAQAHPVLTSKAVRIFGTAISRALNAYAGGDISKSESDSKAFKEMVLNLDGRTLIFDDLERCEMPIGEAMGFINSFVEHENLKVIIIANDSEIAEADYERVKEKLIGKSLLVTSDAQDVLDSLLKELNNQSVISIIEDERIPLVRTFEAFGKPNFRSMRVVLSDYERLVTSVDDRLQESRSALARLLLYMMAIGLEMRSGNLNGNELVTLPYSLHAQLIAHMNKNGKSPEAKKFERLKSTYPEVDWEDPIIPPSSLSKLIETGIIDVASINAHLASHPMVVGHAETPAWRQLWSWSDLPRDRYLAARDKLVRQLQNREITQPGEILHAAGVLLGLADYEDLIIGDLGEIVQYFKKYAYEICEMGKLEPDRETFGFMEISYAGLVYTAKESTEFREIYQALRESTNLSFSEKMKEVASNFVNEIKEDKKCYAKLFKSGIKEGNYADAPFLHYINIADLAEAIVIDWSPDCQLLASLLERYTSEKHNRCLTEEYEWLKEMRKCLDAIADRAEPPHRSLLKTRIEYFFDKIDEAIGEDT